MRTSPVSYCWATAGTRPAASRFSRAAISGSSAEGNRGPVTALACVFIARSSQVPRAGLLLAVPLRLPHGPIARRSLHGPIPLAGPYGYHRGMTLARDERLALCALLEQTGPSAPT